MVELKYNGHDQKRLNEPSRSLRRKTYVTSRHPHAELRWRHRGQDPQSKLPIGYIAAAVLGDVARIDYDFLSLEQTMATPD